MSTWLTGLALAEQNVGLNMLRRLGGETPRLRSFSGDKRFSEPEWSANPMLAGFVEDYQARTNAALQLVDSARLPATTRNKARFAMQLMCDAFSPSNIPWLNPGVVKEATDTGGLSLLHGMQNFMDDMVNNGGYPKQVDSSAFELGTHLAATPGRDRDAQRAHRADRLRSADAAGARDSAALQPAVDQQVLHHGSGAGTFVRRVGGAHGHQTFMISYRNPDEAMSHYTMDHYLRDGLLAAIDAVQEITGAPQVNLAALCLGGTLALIAMAYLAATARATASPRQR